MEGSVLVKSKVTIIIPVYNGEKFLEKTILSALNQTWPYIEVLVIDDGSADKSLDIAKKYEGPKLRVYSQTNSGASAARNRGLLEADGEYIQFLDADDLLSPDKIEAQVLLLQDKMDSLAICSTIHFEDEQMISTMKPVSYDESFISLVNDPVQFLIKLWGGLDFRSSMIQPNAWLTPRLLIEKAGHWNEHLSLDDDGDFFARVVLQSRSILKSTGINYYRKYRYSLQNLSSQKRVHDFQSALTAIRSKKKHLFQHNSGESAKRAIFKSLTDLDISSYGCDPQLSKAIKKEIELLPYFKYGVILGGRVINFLVRVIGWRQARKFQIFYSKYIK